ncbi:MAG: hypothetical protein ACYC6M_06440 [Terriglobales bacterium]
MAEDAMGEYNALDSVTEGPRSGLAGTTVGAATQRCRRLRCKEMFIDPAVNLNIASSGSGIFWCVYTQNCLGPDGAAAGHEECRATRSCYEPL